MAEDKSRNGSGDAGKSMGKQDDGGLGNLPPLSDFDSGGFQSDDGLPPIGSFESDSDKPSAGGLPPLSDLAIETPMPTGGNIKAAPVGFEMLPGDFSTPSFETPGSSPRKSRGFQDPAADSDFSPETPDIGPGPDSDMDTPMFDSAFGGAAGGGFTPAFDTPAPTQAMETPMFGVGPTPRPPSNAFGDQPGFDQGAFGGGFEPGGTPAPDFSPDTALNAAKQPPLPPQAEKKRGGGGGGKSSPLSTILAAVICLVVGIVAGPYAGTKLSFLPNPLKAVVAQKEADYLAIKKQRDDLIAAKPKTGEVLSQDSIDKLIQQQKDLNAQIGTLEADKTAKQADLDKTTGQLEQVRADLEQKNEEFVKTQDAFEDLQNQTAIVQARQVGLSAEVERLTGLVGTLEEAAARSSMTTTALKTSVERLLAQVKEGIPLTPDKYARPARVAAVEDLKTKVDLAKWVDQDLLNAYTSIYLKELEIASSTAYFFARIPVTNGLGQPETKWAECLMKGNWAVYYRSLDGKNIGSYENTAAPGQTPQYAFRETLPVEIQKHIDLEIVASRGPDSDAKLKALAEKQSILEGSATPFQRVFNSL